MNTIPNMTTEATLGLLVTSLLLIAGSARIARLVVFDSYPPSAWLRSKWDDLTGRGTEDESPWNLLLHCAYCLAPWIVLVNGAIGFLVEWHLAWAIFNGWLGLSYLASMMVAYDGDDD